MEEQRAKKSSAIWWGVILVVVGAVLLVSQFVPGIALWRYWPILVIAAGVRAAFGPSGHAWKPRHLTGGLVTVAIGLILLAQMLGMLGWGAWVSVLRLWPLLLISLGIEIAGKALGKEWLRATGNIVIIAGLAYAVLVMSPPTHWWTISGTPGKLTPFSLVEPHDAGIRTATARVNGGVGRLTIASGDDLATAEGESPFTPVLESTTAAGSTSVRIALGEGSWDIAWPAGMRMDVTLDRSVLWDLDVEAGVTDYEIDARTLRIGRLWLDTGVSGGTLILGKSSASGTGAIVADVQAGVSSLTVRVPVGDNARITMNKGLTSLDTRGEWTQRRLGDATVHESTGFSDAGAYWDIRVNAGIGSVTIEYY